MKGDLLNTDASLPEKVKAYGIEALRLHPDRGTKREKNEAKGRRAVLAFEWLAPMTRRWSRQGALKLLEESFRISERHVRRVETIHDANKWGIIEHVLAGAISLEMAEYVVNHASPRLLEAVWAALTPDQRRQAKLK